MMSSDICKKHGDLEDDLVITYSAIGFILLFLCIMALSQLCHLHRVDGFPRSLRISQYSFYVSSILFIFSRIISSMTFCPFPNRSISSAVWQFLFIVYTTHKLCFLLVLYVKLRLVFDETPFAVYIRMFMYTKT